jgi:ribonuclease VapC
MRRLVFDSYAVMAWLEGEPGKGFVEDLVDSLGGEEMWGAICAVNVGEVYHLTHRRRGRDVAESYLDLLLNLSWEVIPATNDLVWTAARLKGNYLISYADAFALACAQQHDAALVTGDPELHAAQHGVEVLWETE